EALRQIFFRQMEIIGCTMGNNKELLDALRPIFEGRIRPVIDRVLPLSEAATAHPLLQDRAAFARIVRKPCTKISTSIRNSPPAPSAPGSATKASVVSAWGPSGPRSGPW